MSICSGAELPLPLRPSLRFRHKLSAIAIVLGCSLVLAAQARAAVGDRAASAQLVSEAEQMIEQAGQSDPMDTTKVRAAVEKLKTAVQLNPRNDSAYVDLGFSYALLKEPVTAVDMYTKAIRINPSAPNFKELADIYLRVGNPEGALMAANAGLSKDEHNAGLYNARGMALTDLHRYDEAARDFRKALDQSISIGAAKVNLDALGSGYGGRSTITKKPAAPGPIGSDSADASGSLQPPVTGFSGSGIQ